MASCAEQHCTEPPKGWHRNTPEDYWRLVRKGRPDECWPWLGRVDKEGRGHFDFKGRSWPAPALAIIFTAGELKGQANHHCDSPGCCNPNPGHVYDGTQQQNIEDRDRRGRTRKGPNPPGSKRPHAKLTAEQVAEIRDLLGSVSQRQLATRYGVNQSRISNIATGRTYK